MTEFAPDTINLSKIPARVDLVNISGLQRTHNDYVARASDGLFKATNFQDVLDESIRAKSYLSSLGIFKSVNVKIDTSHGEYATKHGYDVTFEVIEMSPLIGSIGSDVGGNEGHLNTELTIPNLFGRGERLSMQGSYSNKKTSDMSLKLWKPFNHTSFVTNRPEASISLFRNSRKFDISAFRTTNFGALADVSFYSFFPFRLLHSFQYEASIRQTHGLSKHVPFLVRSHAGPKLASILRHIVTFDSRDSRIFPTSGIYTKTMQEFNGIGTDNSFWMHSTQAELNVSLWNGILGQITTRCGLIQAIKGQAEVPLDNLFYFGGVQSLRGFQFGGASPIVNGASFGVESFWSTGLHIWAPLPFSSSLGGWANNFRSHMFYNFGSSNSSDSIRSAAGIGIAYKLADIARFELNYCLPLATNSIDRVKKGFQFDIGLDFI